MSNDEHTSKAVSPTKQVTLSSHQAGDAAPTKQVTLPPTKQVTLYDLSRQQLAEHLADQPKYRIDQLWDGLYKELQPISQITTLPKALRSKLHDQLPGALTRLTEQTADKGQTIKWLSQLNGGHQLETVLMQYPDRVTVCVSSQAGCAMACSFCATGQAGFDRNLSTGEIVEQVIEAARLARSENRRLSNIVFMGMGEPLANYNRLYSALERINTDIGIGARSLTVSTVGIIPGIEKLAQAQLPVTLAVSLHAANDRLRNELVPINERYPLGSLAKALRNYRSKKGRRVSFEWAMIKDVNDTDRDAKELAQFSKRVGAHINLIPLNPTPGYPVRGSSKKRLYEFADLLNSLGANATVRRTRGVEIDAACGQLAARHRQTSSSNSTSDQPLQTATKVTLGTRNSQNS